MKNIVCCILLLGVVQMSPAQTSNKKYTLVITNANIVDVVKGRIIKNQLLAISGDSIAAVDNTGEAAKYKADQYFDAMGKYVMPGLWDMHIHFRGGDSTIEANKALLPLFLA
jgi:adenine deaminase